LKVSSAMSPPAVRGFASIAAKAPSHKAEKRKP